MEPARKQEIEPAPHLTVVPPGGQALTPMDMLDRAVTNGAGVEVLERLMALQERWEKNQARKAFDSAIADAKENMPSVRKNKRVHFQPRDTSKAPTDYMHETFDELDRVLRPHLSKFGLGYRFRTSSEPSQPVSVTCILFHREGHQEEITLQAGRDDSGNKNAIQGVGSTVTYLQRYTLKAALGVAASTDDDAKSIEGEAREVITEEQARELRELLDTHGRDVAKFCRHYGIEALPELPASRLEEAKRLTMGRR